MAVGILSELRISGSGLHIAPVLGRKNALTPSLTEVAPFHGHYGRSRCSCNSYINESGAVRSSYSCYAARGIRPANKVLSPCVICAAVNMIPVIWLYAGCYRTSEHEPLGRVG